MQPDDFDAMRREYIQHAFDEKDAKSNPFDQFSLWFNEAQKRQVDMPNAMTLATVSESGQPNARIVLLKQYDSKGFVFFTHYESKKGQELAKNPNASLLFYWSMFDRQIRIQGSVEKISPNESLHYFKSRPVASQIAAAVSPQSEEVASRASLETDFNNKQNQIESGVELEKPEAWGGYCLKPDYFEFWQGREDRLHDRLVYETLNEEWRLKRLAP